MTGRPTTSAITDATAECQDCDWTTSSANAATLGNAAQHHDATGHHVTISITRLVTYGRETTPAERGQLELHAP